MAGLSKLRRNPLLCSARGCIVGALLIFVALVMLLVGDVAFMGAPTAFKALAVVIGVGLLVLGFWLITWGRREMAK